MVFIIKRVVTEREREREEKKVINLIFSENQVQNFTHNFQPKRNKKKPVFQSNQITKKRKREE